jgi:hypothetical protein
LTIDAKETSAFKNTKISAPDSRPSSAAMGALGVVLMTVIFALIILSDCITFFHVYGYFVLLSCFLSSNFYNTCFCYKH